jgi:hypothetical protein
LIAEKREGLLKNQTWRIQFIESQGYALADIEKLILAKSPTA